MDLLQWCQEHKICLLPKTRSQLILYVPSDSKALRQLWDIAGIRIVEVHDDRVVITAYAEEDDTIPADIADRIKNLPVRTPQGVYVLRRVGLDAYQTNDDRYRCWQEPISGSQVRQRLLTGSLAMDYTSKGRELFPPEKPGELSLTCYDLHSESIDGAERTSLTAKVRLAEDKSSILIGVEDCGLAVMPTGANEVVCLEIYEGEPRLLVWADVNSEEPTQIISLAGAAESLREDD